MCRAALCFGWALAALRLTAQDGWKYGISVVECTDPTTFLRAVRAPSSRGPSHVACFAAAGCPPLLRSALCSSARASLLVGVHRRHRLRGPSLHYRRYHSDGLQTSMLLRAAESSQH
jgi:hypothetical protein